MSLARLGQEVSLKNYFSPKRPNLYPLDRTFFSLYSIWWKINYVWVLTFWDPFFFLNKTFWDHNDFNPIHLKACVVCKNSRNFYWGMGVWFTNSRHVCFEEILIGILAIGDFWQHVGCPKHLECFLLFVSFRKSSLLGMANLLVQS